MKMKFFVKSVLCLVMLTSLCCSCSDDSESWEELDAPTGEVLPKTVQLSVKLNLPTAVLGNNFKEAGSALVNRLTKNVSFPRAHALHIWFICRCRSHMDRKTSCCKRAQYQRWLKRYSFHDKGADNYVHILPDVSRA